MIHIFTQASTMRSSYFVIECESEGNIGFCEQECYTSTVHDARET